MLSVLPSFKLKRSFNLLIYTFSEKILTKKEKSDIISCGVILTAFFTIWRKNMDWNSITDKYIGVYKEMIL